MFQTEGFVTCLVSTMVPSTSTCRHFLVRIIFFVVYQLISDHAIHIHQIYIHLHRSTCVIGYMKINRKKRQQFLGKTKVRYITNCCNYPLRCWNVWWIYDPDMMRYSNIHSQDRVYLIFVCSSCAGHSHGLCGGCLYGSYGGYVYCSCWGYLYCVCGEYLYCVCGEYIDSLCGLHLL